MNSNDSTLARIGAGFTLLLALLALWPPFTSWWPPQRLFWPLVLAGGALLLLWPEKLPPRLRQLGQHRYFGVVFSAIVGANLWVHSGILWALAALPLALSFWRGDVWSWNPMAMPRARQCFALAAFVALICLRLSWTSANLSTAPWFMGGMEYRYGPGFDGGDFGIGFGWDYNPMQALMPGLNLHFDFAGTQLFGGLWASLAILLVLVAVARRDFSLHRRELMWGVAALGLWWGFQLLRGNADKMAAWVFVAAVGVMLAVLTERLKFGAETEGNATPL